MVIFRVNYINKRAVGLLGLRTGCGLRKFEMQNLKEFERVQRRESECLGERTLRVGGGGEDARMMSRRRMSFLKVVKVRI